MFPHGKVLIPLLSQIGLPFPGIPQSISRLCSLVRLPQSWLLSNIGPVCPQLAAIEGSCDTSPSHFRDNSLRVIGLGRGSLLLSLQCLQEAFGVAVTKLMRRFSRGQPQRHGCLVSSESDLHNCCCLTSELSAIQRTTCKSRPANQPIMPNQPSPTADHQPDNRTTKTTKQNKTNQSNQNQTELNKIYQPEPTSEPGNIAVQEPAHCIPRPSSQIPAVAPTFFLTLPPCSWHGHKPTSCCGHCAICFKFSSVNSLFFPTGVKNLYFQVMRNEPTSKLTQFLVLLAIIVT